MKPALCDAQTHAPSVSFPAAPAMPRSAPLGYRGSLGRDTDLLPLGYSAMRAAGVATSEVRAWVWHTDPPAGATCWEAPCDSPTLAIRLVNRHNFVPPSWRDRVSIISTDGTKICDVEYGCQFAAQGVSQDWFNMQAMARALSDDYSQQARIGADSRLSCDSSLDSRGNASVGGSAYGSMQSDRPVMNSPFHVVSDPSQVMLVTCPAWEPSLFFMSSRLSTPALSAASPYHV